MTTKDERLIPYGGGNFGMPLHLNESLIVPTSQFFVRSNGPTPEIDPKDWHLRISGEVIQELTIDFDQLLSLPQRTLISVLECAGNGRTFFEPLPDGTPWQHDAAGNATWTGVSLRDVLALPGLRDAAVDVVAWGADLANMGRSLPVGTAMQPEVMLVHQMNREQLLPEHGGPVRLIVPGWAGIASTKWLTHLEVIDRPFVGHFQGTLYMIYDADETPLRPVREMPVKSLIATPQHHQSTSAGPLTVSGFAWSGYGGVAAVDVSKDDGQSWQEAVILEEGGPWSWVRWAFEVDLDTGTHVISSRARDQRGNVQPVHPYWNARGYQMNGIQSISIDVR